MKRAPQSAWQRCAAGRLGLGAAAVLVLAGCAGEADGPESTPAGAGAAQGVGGSDNAGGASSVGGSVGVGGAGGDGGTGTVDCAAAVSDVGENVLRRLSRLEYRLTLQDLFGLPEPPVADSVPADNESHGFATLASIQSLSSSHLRAYWDTAAAQGSSLLADSARRDAVVGCDGADAGCLPDFVARFGRLAYRRDLTAEEAEAIATRAARDGLNADDQLQLAIELLLTSPNFLYRVEIGDQLPLSTLSAEEVAARLSFALWGRAPSAELLDQAASGALNTTDGLVAVADSMLQDPKAQEFYEEFFKQWLGFDELRAPNTPPSDYSPTLIPEMIEETRLFLNDMAWQPGVSFLRALDANYSYASEELANYYGLTAAGAGPGVPGRIDFPAGHPRENSGLLSHGAILGAKSDGDLISIRGNWVRSSFLCESLEVPPTLAEVLGEQLVGLTRVQIVEKRNTEVACSGCHGLIDPIGVGLSEFDASGRFDESLDKAQYGIAPALPDALGDPNFNSVAELSAKLAELPGVSQCLAERTFLYVHGREADARDTCAVHDTATSFVSQGHSFASLLRAVVERPEFRLRRAPGAMP